MCFGPVPSFAASAFLGGMGTAVMKNVRVKKELLFAAFPFLFAIQQFIEGVIWLLLKDGTHERLIKGMSFLYLTFAYSLWPVLCPVSVYLIESRPKRKTLLGVFVSLGVITSLYLLFYIIRNPIDTFVLGCSLRYKTFVPEASWFFVTYVMVTIVPYFVSSHRSILAFGLPNMVFCVIAFLIYKNTFISVWCFFAALISANLYVFLKNLHHEPMLPVKTVPGTRGTG